MTDIEAIKKLIQKGEIFCAEVICNDKTIDIKKIIKELEK